MNIFWIKSDVYFWGVQCYSKREGEWSALEIFNPVGSGIFMAVTDLEVWCSRDMQYRLVSHNIPLSVEYGPRNSLFWPSTGPKASKSIMCGQSASGVLPDGNNLRVLNGNGVYTFDRPWAFGEGRGFRVIPDSKATFNWCASFTFAEFE